MFIYVSPCSAAIPSYPTQPPTISPGPHTASKPRRFFVVVVSYLQKKGETGANGEIQRRTQLLEKFGRVGGRVSSKETKQTHTNSIELEVF